MRFFDRFRKKLSAAEASLTKTPIFKQQQELYDALSLLCEDGFDADEMPNGRGEFGMTPSNPVPCKTVFGSTVYLSRLRARDGSKIVYKRKGSTKSDVSSRPIDIYEISHIDGEVLATVFISPYQKRISGKPPKGFWLVDIEEVLERLSPEKATNFSWIRLIEPAIKVSFHEVLEKCPEIMQVIGSSGGGLDRYDFFVTAAVGYLLTLSADTEEDKVSILDEFHKMNSDYPSAIKDLCKFVGSKSAMSDGFVICIGLWVIWNIGKRRPDYGNFENLAILIGRFIVALVENEKQNKATPAHQVSEVRKSQSFSSKKSDEVVAKVKKIDLDLVAPSGLNAGGGAVRGREESQSDAVKKCQKNGCDRAGEFYVAGSLCCEKCAKDMLESAKSDGVSVVSKNTEKVLSKYKWTLDRASGVLKNNLSGREYSQDKYVYSKEGMICGYTIPSAPEYWINERDIEIKNQ